MERERESAELKKLGIEIKGEHQIPPEISNWIRDQEKEQVLSQPITDEKNQIILTTPQLKQTTIQLPLTQTEMSIGLKKNVSEALRWLAEWCKRNLKIRIYQQPANQ
jgi:hypothetical protein